MEAKHILLGHAIPPLEQLPEELHGGVINMLNCYKNRIPDSCQVKLHSDGKSIVLHQFESGFYNILFSNNLVLPVANVLKEGGHAMGLIKGVKKEGEKMVVIIDIGYMES